MAINFTGVPVDLDLAFNLSLTCFTLCGSGVSQLDTIISQGFLRLVGVPEYRFRDPVTAAIDSV